MTWKKIRSKREEVKPDAWQTELIQVAAVAVAALQDHLGGDTRRTNEQEILEMVADERARQEERWGTRSYSPRQWLRVLQEEVGEAASELVTLGYFEEGVIFLGMQAKSELEDKRSRWYQGQPR